MQPSLLLFPENLFCSTFIVGNLHVQPFMGISVQPSLLHLTFFFSHSLGFIVSENSCFAQFFFFFNLKNCIESSMSSASSMAIRQFHSWSNPSKIDPKTHLWCEHCKQPCYSIDTCWHIHDSSSSTNLSLVVVLNTIMCIVAQQGISIQLNIPWIIHSDAFDHRTGLITIISLIFAFCGPK